MLKKLMKYEFKATGRILFPLYCVLLIFAVLCKVFVTSRLDNVNLDFLGAIPMIISIFGYGFTMAAIFVVTFFIIVQRFYKNLLGDEGYLMNTLPVSTWQNITSKLLVGMFWSIISCFVAGLSIVILSLGMINYSELIPNLMYAIKESIDYLGINAFIIPIEAIIAGLLQVALSLTIVYASIALGHLFNKRKILASFGSFIALSIVMNILIGIGAKIFSVITSGIDIDTIPYFMITSNMSPVIITNVILIGAIVINLSFFAIYFGITNYVVKNKLNLE